MSAIRKLLKIAAKILCVWLIALLLLSIVYQGKRHMDIGSQIQVERQQDEDKIQGQEVQDAWMK